MENNRNVLAHIALVSDYIDPSEIALKEPQLASAYDFEPESGSTNEFRKRITETKARAVIQRDREGGFSVSAVVGRCRFDRREAVGAFFPRTGHVYFLVSHFPY